MPKSSIAIRTPRPRDACRVAQRRLGVLQQHALGDLELEPVGRRARLAAALRRSRRRRSRLLNCAGETLTATDTSSGQGAASAQACRSTQSPIGTIRPISSASGMKSAGGTRPRVGMPPAQQRLEARRPRRSQVELRLVVQLELAAARAPGAGRVSSIRRACMRASIAGLEEAVACRGRPPWRGTEPGRPSSAARRRPSPRRAPARCRCWRRMFTTWPCDQVGRADHVDHARGDRLRISRGIAEPAWTSNRTRRHQAAPRGHAVAQDRRTKRLATSLRVRPSPAGCPANR